METLVLIVHFIVAFFMILVVLVQGGNQGGIGAAFGGGNTQGMFGASGATSFLGKLTYVAALIFMVTSLSLIFIQGKVEKKVTSELENRSAKAAEVQGEKEPAAQEPKGSEKAAEASSETLPKQESSEKAAPNPN